MKCGRYIEGARNRQAALDYINANPGQMAPDIIRALGWDKIGGSDRLGKMYIARELDRERCVYTGVNEQGRKFNMTTYRYTARVQKTRGADEIAYSIAANLRADGEKKREYEAKKKKKPVWLTTNTDPERPPIRKQGGQGSGRQRVYVGSTAGMV